MESTAAPSHTMQAVENATQDVAKTDEHLMPGLVTPIVERFQSPRLFLTTRGTARRMGVSTTAVNTALFRDLYSELYELRRIVGMSRTSASRGLQIVRRSA